MGILDRILGKEETEIPVDHPKDLFFSQYNDWCDVREIPKEDRAFKKQDFGTELRLCHFPHNSFISVNI